MAATAIAAAIEEQTAATSEISGNVHQAAQAARDVTENVTLITRAAESTGTASRDALESAQALSQQASDLRDKVAEFLAELAKA